MKIAFVSRWMIDEHRRNGRGAGGGVQQLAQAYRDLGHEVTVLSQDDDATGMEMRSLDGLPVVVTPRWKRLPRFALLDKLAKPLTRHRKPVTDAWWLSQFLKRHGPFGLVMAQCEEPDGLVVALLSCFQKLPPWAVEVSALRYHFQGDQPVFEQRRTLGFVFRRAGLVMAYSDLVVGHLEREYGCPPGKIAIVIRNLTKQFLETPPARDAEQTPTPRVVCLAALNPKKGARFFVEAAALLKDRLPQVQFISIGGSTEGEGYAEELRALAKKADLGDRFRWLGQLGGEKLRDEIATASLLVIPSLFDEWNRAAVEGLAQGRPVVVSDRCGAASWMRQWAGAVIVPAGDARALAGGIERILQDPRIAAAAKENAAAVRAAMTPRAAAEKNLELFRQMLPPGRRDLTNQPASLLPS